MVTEMVEYRPGRWVKVVDGRIVGRATAEEVAAWQAEAGQSSSDADPTLASLVLDVDLNTSPHGPAAEPSRTLDAPRRPAFERRGRVLPFPGAAGEIRPPAEPAKGEAPSRTLEMSAPARARVLPPTPPAEEPGAPVLTRRQAAPALPPKLEVANPATEVAPLPKSETTPRAKPAAPAPRQRPVKASATAAATPEGSEGTIASSAGEGPRYWWIWNAHRQPVEAFLQEWAPKYKAKFGYEVTLVLCHEEDLAAAQSTGLEVEASPLLQPGHFYLGHHNGDRAEGRPKKGNRR